MGVIRRGRKLRFRFKSRPTPEFPKGKWENQPSSYVVGQEELAEKAYAALLNALTAEVEIFGAKSGPVTARGYCDTKFFPKRRLLLEDWSSDETRLNKHALSVRLGPNGKGATLGEMVLRDIRPRHLIDVFEKVRMGVTGGLAPKSIHNVYGALKAMFRDALIDELVSTNPCVLDSIHLGPNEDADPEWRDTAVFVREELEALISDPRLPADRHLLYAIKGIGATRNGEACALRWSHYDPSAANPSTGALGKLTIAKSHSKRHTKTKRARAMPVHPVLAGMLAEWRLSGWPAMMGRPPMPEDLIIPMPAPSKGKG